MSRIDELTIKGVRSFSHEEEQKLTFLQPLTVITGDNGAGKTSIIECLRYACSGFFPPGAQNSCFVHDLKKADKDVVEGFVDLKFKDKASREIKVTRCFRAFQKGSSTKIGFESLPPTLEIFHNDGEVFLSTSPKLKQLNEEMVDGLGVSQTIMVNVMFCHQDESNWPLSDGKHLKEKFDDIFGATRYIKALDSIKKSQKKLEITVSLLRKDAENYEEWKKEAEKETKELEKKQLELDNAKNVVASCCLYLKPKQETLQKMEEKESHFQELKATIRELNAKKDVMESSCKEYQEYCDGIDEKELSLAIKNTKDLKAKKDKKYNLLEQSMIAKMQEEKDLLIKQARLTQDHEDFEALKFRLRRLVNDMAGAMPEIEYEVDWSEESTLKNDLEDFHGRFQEGKRQLETNLDCITKQMSQLIYDENADVEFLDKEKEKMEMAQEDLIFKHGSEVDYLLGDISVSENWFIELEEFHRGKKKSINRFKNSLLAKKIKHCQQECTEKQIMEKLEKKRRKCKDLEEKLKRESGVGASSSSETTEDGSPCITLSNRDLRCPLCSQTFSGNESEKQTILQIMKDKLPPVLKDTTQGKQQFTQELEKIFKVHRTSYLKEKIAKLSEKDIPCLKRKLKTVQTRRRRLESHIRKEEETLKQLQEKENLAAELIPKISILDYLGKGLIKCANDIEAFKKQKKSEGAERRLNFEKNQLEGKISLITEGLITLKNYVKDLDRYTSLREELNTNKSQQEEVNQTMNSLDKQMRDLRLIIDKFEKSISENTDEVETLQSYRSYLKNQYLEIKKVEQQLYTAIEDQRNTEQSLASKETKEQLRRDISDLERKKSEADGSLYVLKEVVENLEKKLSEERFLDVDDKLRGCVINLKTTEMASRDLKKYHKALDSAIIEFHKIKMEEINRIFKEYWTKIYKGNDPSRPLGVSKYLYSICIDYIEIRSESSSSETSARRSYNYRVVVLSNGKEMDMRGRCSAGQKVLASLIIRLALAETFCLSCGVLALDEPTANLDYENKKGLASALAQLIEDKKDSNFQLIVITHDEAFVEMLGASGYADHFYRVTKDSNENSIINRKNMSDLQS